MTDDILNSQKVPTIIYPNRCRLCRCQIADGKDFCDLCVKESSQELLDKLR